MANPEKITIGVAARNEEKTIGQTLRSIIEALTLIPSPAEIIVALNGCTDNTEKVVQTVIDNKGVQIRIVHSEEGLIHAQRKIVQSQNSKGITVFLDADLLIDKRCLFELVQAMLKDQNLYIAWAQVIPYDAKHPRFKNEILNFSDYYPDILSPRVYFSGRAFAVRGYDVPFASVSLATVNEKLADFLRLQTGPLIDDVYLSRAIIHEHGVGAIGYISSAKVYFQPIASLKDFYYSQRRTIFERKRLNLLFPVHSYVVKKYYKRSLIKESYDKLSSRKKFAYLSYRVLYATVRKISLAQYRIYVILLEQGLPLSSCKVWPALKTTKKAFQSETTS
jgi:glycosyltransferase involved in cell wall biosynthesis